MYEEGQGVSRDCKASGRYYDRVCGAGDAEGCYALGLLCYEKRLKDESGRAPRLCGTSCKAGIKAACGILRRLSPAPESPEESQKDEA